MCNTSVVYRRSFIFSSMHWRITLLGFSGLCQLTVLRLTLISDGLFDLGSKLRNLIGVCRLPHLVLDLEVSWNLCHQPMSCMVQMWRVVEQCILFVLCFLAIDIYQNYFQSRSIILEIQWVSSDMSPRGCNCVTAWLATFSVLMLVALKDKIYDYHTTTWSWKIWDYPRRRGDAAPPAEI